MTISFAALKIMVLMITVIFTALIFDNPAFAQNGKKNESRIVLVEKISDDFDSYTFRIFTLINGERAKRGLDHLLWDEDAAKIAVAYSKKMAKENFFGHFDSDNRDIVERARAAKLKSWSKIGENLFSIEQTGKFDGFAVKSWMNSPSHRQNILDPEWTTTGIGIAQSEAGEIYITQIFIKH